MRRLSRRARPTSAGAGALLLAGLVVGLAGTGAGARAGGAVLVAMGTALVAAALAQPGSGRPRRLAQERSHARPRPGAPIRAYRLSAATMVSGLVLALVSSRASTAGCEIVLAGLLAGLSLAAPALAAGLRRVARVAIPLATLLATMVAAIVLHHFPHVGDGVGGLWPAAVGVGVAGGGLVLIADALGAGRRRSPGRTSEWSRITDSGSPRRSVWRGTAGVLMVVWAAVLGLALTLSRTSGHAVLVAASALGVAFVASALLGIPLLVAALLDRQRRQTERTVEDERQRIAAHLHDSVLQTLALVQRQAQDPAAVTHLAHRQEQALRAWMAGEAELAPGRLAAALRVVVAEVEDEAGARVELSIVGDRRTETRDEALLAATREALRNATQHARGSPTTVFAEITAQAVEVSVNDDGPGFVPADVPPARRGIRDAVQGRMAAVGGSALIDSAMGEGTAVLLRLPQT